MTDATHPERYDEVEALPEGAAAYAAALRGLTARAVNNDEHRRQEWLDAAALAVAGHAKDWRPALDALQADRCYRVAQALWEARGRLPKGGAS